MLNNNGEITLPCFTLFDTEKESECSLFHLTYYFTYTFTIFGHTIQANNNSNSFSCETLSKALDASSNSK